MCEGIKQANVITLFKREERLTANCFSWFLEAQLKRLAQAVWLQANTTFPQVVYTCLYKCAGYAFIQFLRCIYWFWCSHFVILGCVSYWVSSYVLTAAVVHWCMMLWWIPQRRNVPWLPRGVSEEILTLLRLCLVADVAFVSRGFIQHNKTLEQ